MNFKAREPNSNDAEEIHSVPNEALGVDKVLCQHCQRTAENGIRCLGMCVADNDY